MLEPLKTALTAPGIGYTVYDEVTPQHMTSTAGMDVLTHAIEAYIGNSTTKQARAAALEAVKLIAENLEKVYNNGNDMSARANMPQAAFLAGGAFSKSYVGCCHAVAHSLGGQYHVPKLMDAKELERFYYDIMEETK